MNFSLKKVYRNFPKRITKCVILRFHFIFLLVFSNRKLTFPFG
jgi:hypothetical protein